MFHAWDNEALSLDEIARATDALQGRNFKVTSTHEFAGGTDVFGSQRSVVALAGIPGE